MEFDDELLLEASQPCCKWDKQYNLAQVELSDCQMIAEKACHQFGEEEISKAAVERITMFAADEIMAYISHYNAVYGVKGIIDAIGVYLHSDIQKNLSSKDFFILALAVLYRC
ncbi:MAG: hypothetical protein ACI4JS_11000 [Oscillospiraceae bacterium]